MDQSDSPKLGTATPYPPHRRLAHQRMGIQRAVQAILVATILSTAACAKNSPETASSEAGSSEAGSSEAGSSEADSSEAGRPSILLITLDTTRADSLGYASGAAKTPHLDALVARGVQFSQAYSTVPTTLPAHISMMTGQYPSEHGIHENARTLDDHQPLIAEQLQHHGYTTAAFVSGLPLSRQFGLARGFDHYDDHFGINRNERNAGATTDRALAFLERQSGSSIFLWVHYFDPHHPYEPPEPFRSRYPKDPYLGEIAYMDQELGRLTSAFENHADSDGFRLIIAGDHGEGLGDHGETFHGNLLYQGVMRVPMIVVGSGIKAGHHEKTVSIRQIFATLRSWAIEPTSEGLFDAGPNPNLSNSAAPVLAEALKPFRQYGWQPQVMAVHDQIKVIQSGTVEVYDLRTDPTESTDLAGQLEIGAELREALRAYPVELTSGGDQTTELSSQDRQRLASLGYVDWQGQAVLQQDAPSARAMTDLFEDLDRGSGLFVQERYDDAIPVFERVLEHDPNNLMVNLRLAVAHSIAGRDQRALDLFDRARQIAPWSIDVRHYQGMHYLRDGHWQEAEALLASVLTQMPRRLPALEGLTQIRRRQGDLPGAAALLERIVALANDSVPRWLELAQIRMAMGHTSGAIEAFEQAQSLAGDTFSHHLELGVLYLADHQLEAARNSLDQVRSSHPGYPMALFKRAQVSVLANEPDRNERIRLAYRRADPDLRQLIENETLFRGVSLD